MLRQLFNILSYPPYHVWCGCYVSNLPRVCTPHDRMSGWCKRGKRYRFFNKNVCVGDIVDVTVNVIVFYDGRCGLFFNVDVLSMLNCFVNSAVYESANQNPTIRVYLVQFYTYPVRLAYLIFPAPHSPPISRVATSDPGSGLGLDGPPSQCGGGQSYGMVIGLESGAHASIKCRTVSCNTVHDFIRYHTP